MADPTGTNITAANALLINHTAPALLTNRLGERLRNIREDLPVWAQTLTSEIMTGADGPAVAFAASHVVALGATAGTVIEIEAVLKTTAIAGSPGTDVLQVKVGSTVLNGLSRTAVANDIVCLRSRFTILTTGTAGTMAGYSAADESAAGTTQTATNSGGGSVAINTVTGEAVTVELNPGHDDNSTTLLLLSCKTVSP